MACLVVQELLSDGLAVAVRAAEAASASGGLGLIKKDAPAMVTKKKIPTMR